MFDAAPKRPSLRLSCSRKLGSVCSGVTLQRHTLAILWFLIIERKSCQNNFPGASLLSVQCTVHSVRASSAASVLFREVRQRVFCPPGQPWIHYFSLVLHQSFVFLWIQNFLGLLYLRFVSNPRIKRQAKDCLRKTERKDRLKLFLCFLRLESKDKTGGGKLQRKQGLEKQLRHHSAAVQTGGKWKYTKTDRWTLTKQRHVIPKFHALETFNSPFSFGYFTCFLG